MSCETGKTLSFDHELLKNEHEIVHRTTRMNRKALLKLNIMMNLRSKLQLSGEVHMPSKSSWSSSNSFISIYVSLLKMQLLISKSIFINTFAVD